MTTKTMLAMRMNTTTGRADGLQTDAADRAIRDDLAHDRQAAERLLYGSELVSVA
jgi:hypothetical protein